MKNDKKIWSTFLNSDRKRETDNGFDPGIHTFIGFFPMLAYGRR